MLTITNPGQAKLGWVLVPSAWRCAWPSGQQGQDPGHLGLYPGFSHPLLASLLAYNVVETCPSQAQEETSNLRLTAAIPLPGHLLLVPMCAPSRE